VQLCNSVQLKTPAGPFFVGVVSRRSPLSAANLATCAANSASKNFCHGTMDAASFLIDWKFAAKFDAYFGFMFSRMNGGLLNGFLARNNIDPAVGLRFRF